MKFGFIGAGALAQTIARHVLPFGHEVLLSNSRGPDTLADRVVSGGLRPIVTTRLDSLTAQNMKTAHELLESRRTIGKIVIVA